ncbi:unnamed protein product [Cuscuta campestris]|uniref:Retrotransposon gag domain-containing protein n=1 Tax=Cuscuta campestris TaxID=132261 RepID=A0A484MYP7_9ASTE|nr:unnamed protein product [Cuscuta campestris]
MMDAIRNLLGVPIAPPDLTPTTTLHNPAPTDIESVECTVGDSVRVLAVDADDVSVGGIVNAFPSDLVAVDTHVDAPGKGEVAKDPALSNIIITCLMKIYHQVGIIFGSTFFLQSRSMSGNLHLEDKDLVRGPPIVPSQIPFELHSFRAHIMGIIRTVTGAPPSPPTLPPRCDGTKPVQWLATVCEYFQFYEVPLVDRLNRVTSLLEGSALAWFNWRMRGGLIDGWEDFVKKFQIRFAPLHNLDYVCFEKTSEKSRDTFAHMVENANTLPASTVEDTNELKELSEESFIKEDNDSGSDIIDNDGGVIDGDDVATITSDKLSYKPDSTPRELHVSLNDLMGVEIAKYDVLECVNKVVSEHCNQAAQLISLDTIRLFDFVKSEHLISKKMIRRRCGLHFYLCLYTSPEKLLEDWSTNGCLFWFITFSHIQKHEWDPPP